MGNDVERKLMPVRSTVARARELRKVSTYAERHLWRALRQATTAWKFRRQHPVGRYIIDIAVNDQRLAIEIDGGQHALRTESDAKRTQFLEERGWLVLRFWNNEAIGNTEPVVLRIINELERRQAESK